MAVFNLTSTWFFLSASVGCLLKESEGAMSRVGTTDSSFTSLSSVPVSMAKESSRSIASLCRFVSESPNGTKTSCSGISFSMVGLGADGEAGIQFGTRSNEELHEEDVEAFSIASDGRLSDSSSSATNGSGNPQSKSESVAAGSATAACLGESIWGTVSTTTLFFFT